MGESARQSGFRRHAEKTKSPAESAQKAAADATETRPAGMSRSFVRGFRASMSRSAIRLNAIADERAPTIAPTIQKRVGRGGTPPDANTAERSAKGSAKTVWEN